MASCSPFLGLDLSRIQLRKRRVAVVFSPALVGIYPAETPVATSAGAFVAQHVTTIGD